MMKMYVVRRVDWVKVLVVSLVVIIFTTIVVFAISAYAQQNQYIPTYTPTKPGMNNTTIQQDSSGNWNINSYNYNTNSYVTGTITKTGNGYNIQTFDTQTFRNSTTNIVIPSYGIGE